jgi:arylsulfatase A-like enzyme
MPYLRPDMPRRDRHPICLPSLAAIGMTLLAPLALAGPAPAADPPVSPANILMIVLDDFGIDQASYQPFGWNGAPLSPSLPVLAAIAQQGVSFRNFWATPECSPSRAAMLTGRHGFRTGVVTAIVDPMLPSVQLHPSEVTVPKLLKQAGYVTGMLGKYHLAGGPSNTPPGFGYQAPASTVGLDFYDGYWDLPPSVDTTLGSQMPDGTYSCGTIGGIATTGAACFPDGDCRENLHPLDAMAMGGTPLLNPDGTLVQSCAGATCTGIDFTIPNAYYAWPRTTTTPVSAVHTSVPHREYLTNFIARRTVEWVQQARAAGRPWLAYTMHSAAHTPIQPPPPMLTGPAANDVSCAFNGAQFRQQFKLMCESADRSIGDMLVSLGLGSWQGGQFILGDLAAQNTMLVVVNDNGTYGYNVLPPFSPSRAKQSVYETGVRSPCIVAGANVVAPGRAVDAPTSIVDLFGLIADAAGVDWAGVATPSRILDCKPMMPYLRNPTQQPIREFQFAMYSQGTFADGQVGPCIVGTSEVGALFTSPGLCVANGGCWMGGASAPPYPVQQYCDLMTTNPNAAVLPCGGTNYCFLPPSMAGQCPAGSTPVVPPTIAQYAVRHGQWKLVVRELPACLKPNDCNVRLYRLEQPAPPNRPGIELPDGSPGVWNPLSDALPPDALAEYRVLRTELVRTLLSERRCLADGNLDGVVDGGDIAGLLSEWGSMGFWDATQDGVVDGYDLAAVLAAWGPVPPSTAIVPACLLSFDEQLVREYTFDDGLQDSSGSGVAAQSMGGTVQGGRYVFGPGQGLKVPLNGLDLSDFAIEFELDVSSVPFPFGKLVDMFGQTEDRGLYRDQLGAAFSILPPFSPMSESRIVPGVPVVVRYARNALTRMQTLSLNGVVQWTQADPMGLAVPPSDGVITFFADDAVTGYQEVFGGSVGWIRISTNGAK